MFFVVIILGFVAVAMAKKAPGTGGLEQSVPPDTSLPSLGATDKFSPALTGGSDLIAKDNRVRLGMVYQNSDTWLSRAKVNPVPSGTLTGIRGGLTDAQASLKTQDVPPLVTRDDSYSPGMFTRSHKL